MDSVLLITAVFLIVLTGTLTQHTVLRMGMKSFLKKLEELGNDEGVTVEIEIHARKIKFDGDDDNGEEGVLGPSEFQLDNSYRNN